MGAYQGHGPKGVGAVCDPSLFSGVVEVAPGNLGPRDGFVAVDPVEPGQQPSELTPLHQVVEQKVFDDSVPNIGSVWVGLRETVRY
jgi:hypothetical protein